MKKTGICWVRWAGETRDHPVWHTWHDGTAYVVAGDGEQPLPGAETAESAMVTARTKDSRARLILWEATVTRLQPWSPEWDEAVSLLQAERLNLVDPGQVAQRWAADCIILRLTPTGATGEGTRQLLLRRPLGYAAADRRDDARAATVGAAPPAVPPATTALRAVRVVPGEARFRGGILGHRVDARLPCRAPAAPRPPG